MEKLFVNGEYVESSSARAMPVENPATEEVIAEVPDASAEDVDRAVDGRGGLNGNGGGSTTWRGPRRCTSARPRSSVTPTNWPSC